MNEFVQFLVNNWQYLSFGLVVLFEIILMIIKKKPSKSVIDNSLTSQLCSLILEAENYKVVLNGVETPATGSAKLAYVLNRYLSLHPEMAEFKDLISDVVEYLLTLPTKKGGCGRE